MDWGEWSRAKGRLTSVAPLSKEEIQDILNNTYKYDGDTPHYERRDHYMARMHKEMKLKCYELPE